MPFYGIAFKNEIANIIVTIVIILLQYRVKMYFKLYKNYTKII